MMFLLILLFFCNCVGCICLGVFRILVLDVKVVIWMIGIDVFVFLSFFLVRCLVMVVKFVKVDCKFMWDVMVMKLLLKFLYLIVMCVLMLNFFLMEFVKLEYFRDIGSWMFLIFFLYVMLKVNFVLVVCCVVCWWSILVCNVVICFFVYFWVGCLSTFVFFMFVGRLVFAVLVVKDFILFNWFFIELLDELIVRVCLIFVLVLVYFCSVLYVVARCSNVGL